jgi:gluconolactonase
MSSGSARGRGGVGREACWWAGALAWALALTAAAGGCIRKLDEAGPCTAERQCTVGFECVEGTCTACTIDSCETTLVTVVGRGGGLACGPEDVCLRVPSMALFSPIAVKVTRTKAVPELPEGYTAITKVYGFEPLNLRLIDPARAELPFSRAETELDRVYVLRTSDIRNNSWSPLGTVVELNVATATVSSLGYFVVALGPRRVIVTPSNDAGPVRDIQIPDAGPATNPLPGLAAPMQAVTGPPTTVLLGTAWDPIGGRVLASDVGQSTLYALTFGMPMPQVLRSPSGGTRGLAVTADGRLIVTELMPPAVVRLDATGMAREVVAEQFEGVALNGPYDVFVRPTDGSIYFTDNERNLMGRTRTLGFPGVFRVAPGGELRAEVRAEFPSAPGALEMSPAYDVLYVTDLQNNAVLAFDVAADGSLSGQRVFTQTQATPQGLAVDVTGNVYVGTAAGLEVYSPQGMAWGALPLAGGLTELAFGGPMLDSLFGTSARVLYQARATVRGAH